MAKRSSSWMSCDMFVALPPATANGCVVFGKNADRPDEEIQEIAYVRATDHKSGAKLLCTYIEIDQVAHTHGVILSKPAWMWGAEMGANDQGVCIGNEAVWTRLNSEEDLKDKLPGMDLVRLGLERGSNARESLDVITSLLGQYGQGGACSEAGQWSYHNSFIIADNTTAWLLETAGNYWAAEKITEGVRNISNDLSITTKMDLMSANLVEEAMSAGLYKPEDGPFNFAKVFAQDYTDPAKETHSRFCYGRKLLKEYSKEGKFEAKDMMKILRDEDSGICMPVHTRGSQVSVLTPVAGNAPCCHWFTATPNPQISMFKPFIFGPNPSIGDLVKSPDYGNDDPLRTTPRFQKHVERRHELFKEHEKLQALLDKDDPKGHMIVQNIQELEVNCIADIEEILKAFDEQSFPKVAELFSHMCSIEINFYKHV